jgi:hypothetical protein
MAPSDRISADALSAELSKIPVLTHGNAKILDAVRLAVTKAIASGQSADQLASDLNIPAAWKGIDLSKPPSIPPGGDQTSVVPVAKDAQPVPTPIASAPPPDWAKQIVPIALKDQEITRVVVLDREPTALGGLELPPWARAQKPAATFGPITVFSANLQATTEKWIIIFRFTGVAQFVRSGTVLCVLPISILRFGHPTQATITAGSAWIAVNPFASGAPAGSFAGITVNSGLVSSDQPLVLSGAIVTVAPGAVLDLQLTPSPLPGGPIGFPATVTAPASISVSFPATGAPSIAFSGCAAVLYGQSITCSGSIAGVSYSPQLNLLVVPGKIPAGNFSPAPQSGKLVDVTGTAQIQSAGWAFNVSQATDTTQLGNANGPGDFALACGAGLLCQWSGLAKPEAEVESIFLAQNTALVLFAISKPPTGVVSTQTFDLWVDQDSPKQDRCRLVATRGPGELLTYAIVGTSEIVEYGAVLDALVDRPLLASGARVPARFIAALVALIRNTSGNRLFVFSATPPPNIAQQAFPMALDNALLEVSEPGAIFLSAETDSDFNANHGVLFLLFGYILAELYLPDPYTGGIGTLASRPGSVGDGGATVSAGFLISSVTWTSPAKAALRLFDTAHAHPATPPTTEASSPAVAPARPLHFTPLHLHPAPELQTTAAAVEQVGTGASLESHAAAPPPPDPLPSTTPGVVLLDLSTRASQLGVEVTTQERLNLLYTIDGLSVRGPAALLPLVTLPAMAWEPMYDLSTAVDPQVNDFDLLHPPGDGPLTQVRAISATLIPIAPLQSLQSVLDAGRGHFTARLTLPFGMVGALDAIAQNNTILPEIGLVQPGFNATLTPTGVPYTGAWQLSIFAPNPTQPDPVLAGRTYLRMPTDNPPLPNLSYGEMALGSNAALIFESEFDPPQGSTIGTGVPLRRYDLTGYGASTFSEWTAQNPPSTAVIKAHFHVLVGRTSREVIQVQSIICPWAIRVVRTITIDRQASGVVHRVDSGWQPASDGLFNFPSSTGITRDQIHAGVIGGVIQIKNIQQLGLQISATGTQDGTGFGGNPAITKIIPVQPVTFNGDVIINPQHAVLQGGAKVADLAGAVHTCVPSKEITGYIPLQFDFHLAMIDMVNFSVMAAGAGGPINATLNIGGSDHLLRVTEFDATPVNDSVTGGLGLPCAVRGVPKLSSDGAWSVAARTQTQPAPVPIHPAQGAPVVQPNTSGGTAPGNLIHYANPADIFRLAPGSTTLPDTLYGFLQTTGTQSNLLSRPVLTVGSQNLTLQDALNVAHAGALLGAISSFPPIANCLQFLSSELQPIKNQLTAPSLSTTQNLFLKPAVRSTPIPLITTSIANVNLYFYQKGDDLTKQADPPNVVITLGSPTDPSWSLDVNHLAVGLVIPALSSKPVIWFQGAFHADADTAPAFPNLQTAFDSPLDVLTTIFSVLNDFASILSPGGGSSPEVVKAHDAGSPSNSGLQVSFSDGKLVVSDGFTLPNIPLGLGSIQNVSLDIGTTLNILALTIDFLVSIGTPDAPCHWIVDPLSGTIALQAGILNNKIDILIQAGIGLGLAIDLGIASGSASITIAVQVQVNGSVVTLLLLLNGQAQVSVLGGLASAAITLTAGLGFSIDLVSLDINLIGTASVGIHISICWVVNISWSGSWTFQKQLPYNPLKQIA